ncbi:MAG: universal stress protein [Mycobacterium sp.]|nr:universal stress protein [Mycobacterium sp.]
MIEIHTGDSVVVGIDGSAAAVYAAKWAIDEAIARDVPLRLVSCTPHPQSSDRLGAEYASTCLRAAHAAIEESAAPVKIETAILEGDPTTSLIEESEHAAMVCVGSVGIGRFAKAVLGSTAAELAERASCPVAVIRGYTPRRPHPDGSIMVEVTDWDENHDVIAAAVAEAELRKRPIVTVGICPPETGMSAREELQRRTAIWQDLYPEVQITSTPTTTSFVQFLGSTAEPNSLVVVGAHDATDLANIIGSHADSDRDNPSVLIVRA